MKRVLKWVGIGFGSLLGLLLVVVIVLSLVGANQVNRSYEVQPEAVTVGNDTDALKRGHYLTSISCAGCHGDDLGGKAFFDDPALGSIPAPNLTSGQGGAAADYSDADFVRAIRHGIDSEGKPLMIMPSTAFWHLSDADLGAIIAYLRSAPPVDNDWGEKEVRLVGRALIGAGVMDLFAAEHIDHSAPRPDAPAQQVDVVYGEYLLNTNDCRQCHGATLAGGQSSEPGAPPGPNLTPGGELATWTAEDFITAMRTGVTPGGRSLNPTFMPWQDLARMTDDDLTALFLYLQSLPTAISATE